ncbi:hypothetical protein EWM64_g10822 [Hericium alpestre]|uniref:Uncharacterized protein n=1 Tax=Hericium alpestre TaxID=135208 RepID=A0A4Y9ZG92_9AGAM|nr:hypothetical protein EWM64_g10822 [Hericium alpestre]
MGISTDNAASKSMYALTAGALGALARINAEFYAVAAKTQGMTKNDFTVIVQTLYPSVNSAEQIRILDQLWAANASPPIGHSDSSSCT